MTEIKFHLNGNFVVFDETITIEKDDSLVYEWVNAEVKRIWLIKKPVTLGVSVKETIKSEEKLS